MGETTPEPGYGIPAGLLETGLSLPSVAELLAKILLDAGRLSIAALSVRTCLAEGVLEPVLDFLRKQRLIEAVICVPLSEMAAEPPGDPSGPSGKAPFSPHRGDVLAYQLTDAGRKRAQEYSRRCSYRGPAPVALADYCAVVRRQSVRRIRVTRLDVERAFADAVIDVALLDRVGAALNGSRGLLLFGPSGAGKSFIAERLGVALPGAIRVPYAVEIDGEVVSVFDPAVHRPLTVAAEAPSSLQGDPRWVWVARPCVRLDSAGILSRTRGANGFRSAPPQMLAAGGILVLDDLGREGAGAAASLDRMVTRIERGEDDITLTTGAQRGMPLDLVPVYVTSLALRDIADDALLRRLGTKVHVRPLVEGQYRELFERICEASSVLLAPAALDHLIALHRASGKSLLPCVPRTLVDRICDYARYRGEAATLTPALIEWAWQSEFVDAA